MYKFFVLLFLTLFISGCSSSNSFSTTQSNLAVVPHHKNSIPMVVILVNFSNKTIGSSNLTWSSKMFGTQAHQLNNYFAEVSDSQFQYTKANENYATANDGIIEVTLNKTHPNISIDSSSFDTIVHGDLLLAMTLADKYIDFSNYDFNANGHITPDELIITFIIAGYEDAYEGRHVQNGIWAHQNCVSSQYTPTLDSVTLMGCADKGNYALFGEEHNILKPHYATIGIIAHELGHSTFSLPDLYNTAGSTGGIGYFGLMGAGVWAKQSLLDYAGATPPHFCAWSKLYLGWYHAYETKGSTVLYATNSSSYNILKIPIDNTNYYLLENRNNSGYDTGLYSLSGNFDGGIAIWHINETYLTVKNFDFNNVNSITTDKGVDLIEATVQTIDQGYGGDEAALFYNPNLTYYDNKVSSISAQGSAMTLNVN